jgi:hypothetical protein
MAEAVATDLEAEFGDRFCFWTGKSGKRYIHSVYAVEDCPPLPGAVYIEVVRGEGGTRHPVRAGRFPPFWDMPPATSSGWQNRLCEVHVHLLATGETDCETVLSDLACGLDLPAAATRKPARDRIAAPSPVQRSTGFGEQVNLPLFAGLAA